MPHIAGKDRTGVIAAIILKVYPRLSSVPVYFYRLLKLAGVSNTSIAEDYALTRVGREPLRERSLVRLSMEPIFASNSEAALNMFTCPYVSPTQHPSYD
jgi:protein tyrosine/serine phosphatase